MVLPLLRTDDGSWRTLLNIYLLNSGQSPAADVRFAIKAVAGGDPLAIARGIAELREEIKDQKLALRLAVFPGQKHRVMRSLVIPPSAVKPLPPYDPDAAAQLTPAILVAVTYQFEGSDKRFETGFGYAMILDDFLVTKVNGQWPTIGLKRVKFEDIPEGSYAT